MLNIIQSHVIVVLKMSGWFGPPCISNKIGCLLEHHKTNRQQCCYRNIFSSSSDKKRRSMMKSIRESAKQQLIVFLALVGAGNIRFTPDRLISKTCSVEQCWGCGGGDGGGTWESRGEAARCSAVSTLRAEPTRWERRWVSCCSLSCLSHSVSTTRHPPT